MARTKKIKGDTSANLGFEAKLWAAADALRNNMDAAEYKHVVLGLIFLKYISDAFEAKHAELDAQKAQGADPEDRDEYRAARIFWVPKEARWQHLKANPTPRSPRSARWWMTRLPVVRKNYELRNETASGIAGAYCGMIEACFWFAEF